MLKILRLRDKIPYLPDHKNSAKKKVKSQGAIKAIFTSRLSHYGRVRFVGPNKLASTILVKSCLLC